MKDQEVNPAFASGQAPDHKLARETALFLLTECGFAPVPVYHQSKIPIEKDWGNQEATEDSIHTRFANEPMGVGVVLGPPSGGLVDVDLDCAESQALAPYLLPPTELKRGRKSARETGYFYFVDDDVKYVETRDPILP